MTDELPNHGRDPDALMLARQIDKPLLADGLRCSDMIVTHLDEPAALLVNSTPVAGRSLSLSLHGVISARDAIGTTVTATIAGHKTVRQLTAGDGYLASNERKVVIGVGTATLIDELAIRWPSGMTTTMHAVPSNQEITLIEGHEPPTLRPAGQR